MSPAEIEALASECGASYELLGAGDEHTSGGLCFEDDLAGLKSTFPSLLRFASALRAQVLEEAAKVCDDNAIEQQMVVKTLLDDTPRKVHSRECAASIRALKDKTNGV